MTENQCTCAEGNARCGEQRTYSAENKRQFALRRVRCRHLIIISLILEGWCGNTLLHRHPLRRVLFRQRRRIRYLRRRSYLCAA